jgi:hypothetical protein
MPITRGRDGDRGALRVDRGWFAIKAALGSGQLTGVMSGVNLPPSEVIMSSQLERQRVDMDIESLRAGLEALFNHEQDEDGGPPTRDIPHPKLGEEHGLDLLYLETPAFMWEGSTIHPHTRVCLPDEPRLPL